jgi:hypothetical protein
MVPVFFRIHIVQITGRRATHELAGASWPTPD